MDKSHIERVRKELKAAGVGSIGMLTPESKRLANIVHADEHIGGAVYGRYSGGLAWLVATNSRIIFMDHKPFYATTDEMTYDVVAGVQSTQAGPFDAVILHTRVNNYTIRFVNPKAASKFIEFIETRRLEGGEYNHAADYYNPEVEHSPGPLLPLAQDISEEALDFLKRQDIGVLSTVDRTGNAHGAVIYYITKQDKFIYITTKSDTGKGRNIIANGQVALTVYEPGTAQTVQLQGIAEIETDKNMQAEIFKELVRPRTYVDGTQMPPITKLHEGAYMVVRITPSFVSYHDYSNM
jgi:general stress protein 26